MATIKIPWSGLTWLQIYYLMRLTRAMEDRTRMLFLQGRVVGGVYTAQGHEATTVGAASTLDDGDIIVPQHRDLGMHLTRGGSPRAVMTQWLARGNSPALGRDGQILYRRYASWHRTNDQYAW